MHFDTLLMQHLLVDDIFSLLDFIFRICLLLKDNFSLRVTVTLLVFVAFIISLSIACDEII